MNHIKSLRKERSFVNGDKNNMTMIMNEHEMNLRVYRSAGEKIKTKMYRKSYNEGVKEDYAKS